MYIHIRLSVSKFGLKIHRGPCTQRVLQLFANPRFYKGFGDFATNSLHTFHYIFFCINKPRYNKHIFFKSRRVLFICKNWKGNPSSLFANGMGQFEALVVYSSYEYLQNVQAPWGRDLLPWCQRFFLLKQN